MKQNTKKPGLLYSAIQNDITLSAEQQRIMFDKAACYINLAHVLTDVADSLLCDLDEILRRYHKRSNQDIKLKFKKAQTRVEQARKCFADLRSDNDPKSASEQYARGSSDFLRDVVLMITDRVTDEKQQEAMRKVIARQANINNIFPELNV